MNEFENTQNIALKLSRPLAECISLEQRRHEADRCEVLNHVRRLNICNPSQLFNRSTGNLRGQGLQIRRATRVRISVITFHKSDSWLIEHVPEKTTM